MSKIHLYAEVLTNIRQISLHAALSTTKNEESTIHISSDKKVVTVTHDGDSSSIYLPTEISGTANVEIPVKKKKEITVRLSLEDTTTLPLINDDMRGNESPWAAQDLFPATAIRCKSCEESIMETGKVQVWRDLPSENWYEMMDYWHCHKPHETSPDAVADVAESKGYAATSRVTAKKGTGFIDIGSFLMSAEDCAGLKIAPTTGEHDNDLIHCAQCDSFLGWHDTTLGGHRLHKSRLHVKPDESSAWESFPAAAFICAQLLALIESQAIRKFIVHSGSDSGLLIWVFNPDIHYSSSARSPPTAHRAMKVFYKSNEDPIKMLDENTSTMEELRLPLPLLQDFEDALREGSSVLPQSARKFQEWDVAVLDRYEKYASTAMDRTVLTQKASPLSAWPEGIEGIEGLLE